MDAAPDEAKMANTNDSPHANWQQFDRGETQHVDYKAPLGWDATSKPGLMKDIIAMANTRDGGRLVIGVREHPETRSFDSLNFEGDVEVRFRWTNMLGRYLVFDQGTWQPERHVCHEPEIREKAVLRVVDLRSAWEPVAVELVTRVCGLFQVEASVRDAVPKRFEGIRAGRE